jgi:hypothetical protein
MMKLPKLATTIERRIFTTYAVDPEQIIPYLPEGIKPQLVNGKAIAGVCLLRMGNIRPSFISPNIGITAENAGHRIAVTYLNDEGQETVGVYAPFRHTNSRLAVAASGTIFPGIQKAAHFDVHEAGNNFKVNMTSKDVSVEVDVDLASEADWSSQLFPTFAEASAFYEEAKVAWSPTSEDANRRIEPLKLEHAYWEIKPAHINHIHTSFFDSFPKGTVRLDHALIMQNVPAWWSNEK